ncbi:translation initiation factor [Bacteroidia bacterium]|jgi:translation initiation factor 1|nr:translation initiation factor [Bacteroidia bacterium]MDC1430804.1 translation initiation factor [Bacteroidia bacterium]|tara:strand:- start:22 stop:396 length:375 start_codon:yes stop_codon:yes gene_type:complete
MTKKKMEKLDLSNFFTSQNEDTGFKVLSDVDGKAKEEDTTNLPANAQKLTVRKEKKGRGGKTVTVVEGYKGNPQTLETLCKKVKQQCGVGGSVDRKTFIIQGDKADQVVKILIKEGYNAKKTTM